MNQFSRLAQHIQTEPQTYIFYPTVKSVGLICSLLHTIFGNNGQFSTKIQLKISQSHINLV